MSIMLVPYLERIDGKDKGTIRKDEFVCTEKPPDNRLSWGSRYAWTTKKCLLFALKEQNVSEYHYRFYHLLAALVAGLWSEEMQTAYETLLREELNRGVHGEVDEESWPLKQALLRRQTNVRHDTTCSVTTLGNPLPIRLRSTCTASAAISTWKPAHGSCAAGACAGV